MDTAKSSMGASGGVCDERYQQYCRQLHLHRLRNVKPAIDNKPPPRRPHLKQALKRRQMEDDKRRQIAHENRILLQRMKEMVEKGSLDRENRAAAYVGSLQKDRQKQEELRIADANHELLRRIQRSRSSYERDSLLREHREKARLRDRISRRKPAPKERSAYDRHYSTLTSFTAVPRSTSRLSTRGHGPLSSFRARETRSVPSLPAV